MNAKKEQLLIDLQRHLNHCRDERATLHQDVMQLRIANETLRRELARERTWRQKMMRIIAAIMSKIPSEQWPELREQRWSLIDEIEATNEAGEL